MAVTTVKGSVWNVADNNPFDAPIEQQVGSAGSPTYTFTSDTDTGMFSAGSNLLAFSTNAVERVRLTASEIISTNNLNIERSTPTITLKASNASDDIFFNANDSTDINRSQIQWDESAESLIFRAKNSAGSTVTFVALRQEKIEVNAPFQLESYTVAGVPNAGTSGAGAMIYVSNESGGAVPAFSDGTNWRRVTDRAIIS